MPYTANHPGLRKMRTAALPGILILPVTRHLHVLTSTFAVSGAFMLVLFIAAYIGLEPGLYHSGILSLIPARERDPRHAGRRC